VVVSVKPGFTVISSHPTCGSGKGQGAGNQGIGYTFPVICGNGEGTGHPDRAEWARIPVIRAPGTPSRVEYRNQEETGHHGSRKEKEAASRDLRHQQGKRNQEPLFRDTWIHER
jgi:hypothetical protein